jgi:osmotically-inducible protein OsmY
VMNRMRREIACALLLGSALSGCALLGRPDERDARITADVQAQFAQHAELQAPNLLDVQTVHRVVYLRGLVDTPYERAFAESVARQVAGVSRVENLIGLSNAK